MVFKEGQIANRRSMVNKIMISQRRWRWRIRMNNKKNKMAIYTRAWRRRLIDVCKSVASPPDGGPADPKKQGCSKASPARKTQIDGNKKKSGSK